MKALLTCKHNEAPLTLRQHGGHCNIPYKDRNTGVLCSCVVQHKEIYSGMSKLNICCKHYLDLCLKLKAGV